MQVDKGTITDSLRAQGDHDRAQHAECVLPRVVDTRRDAGLLAQLDVHLAELLRADDPG